MAFNAMHAEIEQLFIKLELEEIKSLCITANKSKAGTTSVAMALAERYLLAGFRTLYVDFNLANPNFDTCEIALNDKSKPIDLIEHKASNSVFSGIVAPLCKSKLIKYRNPNSLQTQLTSWFEHYDRIIFDAAPVDYTNQMAIPATVISSVCNATILIVKAGESTTEELQNTLAQLKATNAQFVGIILNQYKLKTLHEAILTSMAVSFWLPNWLKIRLQASMTKYSIFRHVL